MLKMTEATSAVERVASSLLQRIPAPLSPGSPSTAFAAPSTMPSKVAACSG